MEDLDNEKHEQPEDEEKETDPPTGRYGYNKIYGDTQSNNESPDKNIKMDMPTRILTVAVLLLVVVISAAAMGAHEIAKDTILLGLATGIAVWVQAGK